MGLRGVVTAGIVTGAGQATVEERTRLGDLIQADVLLAPGNSGGPLADVEGRVLGINAMISAGGIALAVPSAVVQAFVAPQRGSQPYLGITGTGVRLRTPGKERGGVVLISVEEGSPADRAGLMQGDIVLGSGERELESGDDLQIWLACLPPDEAVQLRVLRGGEPREFTVVPTLRVAV